MDGLSFGDAFSPMRMDGDLALRRVTEGCGCLECKVASDFDKTRCTLHSLWSSTFARAKVATMGCWFAICKHTIHYHDLIFHGMFLTRFTSPFSSLGILYWTPRSGGRACKTKSHTEKLRTSESTVFVYCWACLMLSRDTWEGP